MTLKLHSVNKQNNKELCSQLMFFHCSQHRNLYSYIVQCFHYFVHPLYVESTSCAGRWLWSKIRAVRPKIYTC